jgi:hypothetical protein
MPYGDFSLWIDGSQWKQSKPDSAGILTFESQNGEGYARVITERIGMPLNVLADAAVSNMRKTDAYAKLVLQETRVVNGREVVALQVDLTSNKIPVRFYGYCYSGSSGSIQAWTYTSKSLFDANQEGFTRFLNGLEIASSDVPNAPVAESNASAGNLSLNSGKAILKYDTAKWKQKPSTENGRTSLTHLKGDGYALVISERIGVAMDSLPGIALSNAKAADPNARVILQEKRSANGVPVWFVKIGAVVNGTPFTYFDYLYGGDAGTIQVIAFTGTTLAKEYEADFMELLNGLTVLP